MNIEIIPYTTEVKEEWERLCGNAINATFLHTQRFLEYHRPRFEDASVLLLSSGNIVGIFPAAVAPGEKELIISHPGATYGGIVHQGWLIGTRMIEAIEALCLHYASRSYQKLLYKALPYIYMRVPAQDDLYALFRYGAKRVRCDLSCVIDLLNRLPLSERRRRGVKKALKSVTLSSDADLLAGLWLVIEQNLARKHGTKPVHSINELRLLQDRFPQQIAIRCALINGKVEAGIILFNSHLVWHAQYIASSETGCNVSALDAVFDSAIADATQAGARYFDFGISNENNGQLLNDGLYRFKSEFGGGGVAYEFYELGLLR